MPPQPPTPNNTEIDQALKEFEVKSGAPSQQENHIVQPVITPQTPKKNIEGVSFDTDTEVEAYTAIKFYKETVEPKLVKAVMKYSGGAIKDQRQAEWILFGFVVVVIGVSLYLFFGSGYTRPQVTPAMVEQMQQGHH